MCSQCAFVSRPWISDILTLPMLLQRFILKLEFNGSCGALTHYQHCFNLVFKTFFFVSTIPGRLKILTVNSEESRLVIYLLMWNIIVYPLKLQHISLLSGSVPSGSLIFTHSRPLVTGHFKLDEGETSGAEGPAFVLRHRNLNSHTTDPMSPRETPNTGPSTSHLSTSECSSHNGVSIWPTEHKVVL